jgi:hypothetical protein
MMTPQQSTDYSIKMLEQFKGMDTGDVITVLATALQMAICYGAQNKQDAVDMLSCLMVDAENNLPRQYDIVQSSRLLHKNAGKEERLQ